jgi:hypothetical protein
LNINLNIIALNNPYPPDYGGVIDAYYRIEALHQLGVKIHLHCFEYGRCPSTELERLCSKVTYYPRSKGFRYQLSAIPYIVATRVSDELVRNLEQNDYPIFFEGLHTTFCIQYPQFANRLKIVRAHNIEHRYYRTLAKLETNVLHKLFFLAEAVKLKYYEKVLKHADYVLCVSHLEHDYVTQKYHNSVFVPSSHPFNKVESVAGKGDYILYHGDLSVNENITIASFLITNVFSKVSYPCIIAGKNPSAKLLQLAGQHANVRIEANPDNTSMQQLIRDAHIHLLPVMQNNGLKLKLLLALYAGRFCMVNRPMVEGTFLEPLCIITETAAEMIDNIHQFMQQPFTDEMAEDRKKALLDHYNNEANARRILDLL